MILFMVSAKSGEGIPEMFTKLAEEIGKNLEKNKWVEAYRWHYLKIYLWKPWYFW